MKIFLLIILTCWANYSHAQDPIIPKEGSSNSEVRSQNLNENVKFIQNNSGIIETIDQETTENNDNYFITEIVTESSSYGNDSNGNLSISTSGDTEFPYALVITLSVSGSAAIGAVIGFTWKKKKKCHLKLSFRAEEKDAGKPETPAPDLSIKVEPSSSQTEVDTNGHFIPNLIRGISNYYSSRSK